MIACVGDLMATKKIDTSGLGMTDTHYTLNYGQTPSFSSAGLNRVTSVQEIKLNPLAQGQPSDLHVPGAKDDQGKVRVGMVLKGFCHALWEVSKLGTFGAQKHVDFGFLSVPNGVARYEDAGLRHKFSKWMADDDYAEDAESEVMEAAAEAWNALAHLELLLRKRKEAKDNG